MHIQSMLKLIICLYGKLVLECHLTPHIAEAAFQLLRSAIGGSVGILTYKSMLALLHLGECPTSGENFQKHGRERYQIIIGDAMFFNTSTMLSRSSKSFQGIDQV